MNQSQQSLQPTVGQTNKAIEDTWEKPSGIRIGLHGIAYQIKLLMLVMFRGWANGQTISLGTEVTDADKFDDVVVCINKGNAGKEYRFLQAKHRQDGSRTIKTEDLLKPNDDDFSIHKYFISYLKIKGNVKFGGDLKDFFICTNIGVDSEVTKAVEARNSSADIFDHHKRYDSKQFKFVKGTELYDKLVLVFKEHHRNKLAASVAKIVANKRVEPDILLKNYAGWLMDNVFEAEASNNKTCVKFQDKFLHERCEGDVFLGRFKDVMIKSYLDLKTKISGDIDDILKNLKAVVPPNFNLNTKTDLPLDVTDIDIDTFFDKLVLAVDQPNVQELDDILEREISIGFNIVNGKLIYSRLLVKVMDWVNERNGRFLQPQDIHDIFQSLTKHFRFPEQTITHTFKRWYFTEDVKVVKIVKYITGDDKVRDICAKKDDAIMKYKENMKRKGQTLKRLRKKVLDLDNKTTLLEKQNKSLEEKIEGYEQRDVMRQIEIKGLELRKGENLIELCRKVARLIMVDPESVESARRIKEEKGRVGNIVVTLRCHGDRDIWLANRRGKRLTNTDVLGKSKSSNHVYINEYVSKSTWHLFVMAKILLRDKYKHIWINNSVILIRKNDRKDKVLQVSSEADVHKYKNM